LKVASILPIVEFNASIGFDIELIEYNLHRSIAHAKMLAYTGIISHEEADSLVSGLEQIRQEYRTANFNRHRSRGRAFCRKTSFNQLWEMWAKKL